MFSFFIVVNSFPGAGGKNKRPAPFAGRVFTTKRPCPCVLSTRTGSVKRFCGATLLVRQTPDPSRRANTPLPCNGGFRSKLLGLYARSPDPQRSTKPAPLTVRFHCPDSLQMRFAGSLPPHRFSCIIHFICVKSRGNFKFFSFCRDKVTLRSSGAFSRQSIRYTPATGGSPSG